MSTRRPLAITHPFHWDEVRRGGERYVADLADYLATRGHDVEVIVGTQGRPGVERCGGLTIRRLRHLDRHRLQAMGLRTIETFGLVLLAHLARHRYRLVHVTTPSAALAARVTGHPTLYTVLGHPTPDQFGHRPLDRQLFGAAVRGASRTVAFSTASARATEQMFGGRCGVLPLGVRLDRFTLRRAPRTGPPVLLFAGFPGERRKRLDLALAALPDVLKVHPDARLLVPGDAAVVEPFRGVLDPVRDAVELLGILPGRAMPGLYARATVSLLPSVQEALGIALVESLACGTPVVCADDAGAEEVVRGAGVGRVFRADDAMALGHALLEVIELAARPSTPAKCAQHATRWGWVEGVGPLHEQVYAELARG